MANYLREPYSADLDFGTGEWSVSAWVNVPVSFPTANFPAIGSDLVDTANTTAAWTVFSGNTLEQDGDAVKVTCGGGDARGGFWGLAAAGGLSTNLSLGKTYRLSFEAKVSSGATVGYKVDQKVDVTVQDWGATAITSTEYAPYSLTFTSDEAGSSTSFTGMANGDIVWIKNITVYELDPVMIVDRSGSSGAEISFGVNANGTLLAKVSDGTTSRFVSTTAAYNTATWAKAEACYTTDGTLAIMVNGVEVAATRGAPLLTLNNSNAVLTIGNSYNADAPFPGSLALLKLSATVPTAEQSQWMYEQEKQMFREGAQVCLPDSSAIVDLAYDDATDKWIAVSASNESEWSGLVRTSVTAVPAGSYTKAAAASGVQLLARSTTNPGVDITIPAYGLRKELVKRAESAARLARSLTPFDYVGGFTASTTNGSTSITSVAGLSYPTSYVGARVTGSGIPADTVITAVSGTTIYLSKAATATATGVQISFTDFILPVGYEAKAVLSAGSVKTEGSTKDYTRLFDGFRETIRFGTAPGYQAAVQIQATRSAA